MRIQNVGSDEKRGDEGSRVDYFGSVFMYVQFNVVIHTLRSLNLLIVFPINVCFQ